MNKHYRLYTKLLQTYGPQGWWPVPARYGEPGYTEGGYHPGVFPVHDAFDRFIISVGAVLTQNTAWKNARLALDALSAAGVNNAEDLLSLGHEGLAELIRPSGYYNQKARKLILCMDCLHAGGCLESGCAPPRKDLLDIWGIGPETADSILLYAFRVPVFVIDAYTKRLTGRLFRDMPVSSYEGLQKYFQDKIPEDVILYQEYHALIVRHCKDVCRKSPLCRECFLTGNCAAARFDYP